jgi:orotate phosphoribosyltransferase
MSVSPNLSAQHHFLTQALALGALQFGEFKTKAGRLSPYFFNTGRFNSGAGLALLGEAYATRLLASELAVDQLYGPAYKGIPLVSALALSLAQKGRDLPYSFNRKEAKDHGEGGLIVGAPLKGRVLIVDDVITAGTSVRESLEIIKDAGATPAGVLITLDRMERGTGALSAVQEVTQAAGIPVLAIASVLDVLALTQALPELQIYQSAITAYRQTYGV